MGDSALLELACQLLANGIIGGSLYALAGVSWGIGYNATDTFHYFHSFLFSLAGYVTVFCLASARLPLAVSVIAVMLVSAIFGCAIEACLYRPLRRKAAQLWTIFLASMGTATVGFSLLLLLFSANPRSVSSFLKTPVQVGPVGFIKLDLVIVPLCWALIILVIIFMSKTDLGKAIRAAGINREMAEISGLDVNRIYLIVYAIGSALFGAQAFLYTIKYTATPFMGFTPFVYAFTAVFLGGVGSIPGAAIGGFVIGLAEQIGMIIVPGEYKMMIGFSILFIVMLFRPQGLFGPSRQV